MLLVSVSLLKHINTNSSSFYSIKRKIERKFEESKNSSYFVKAKNARSIEIKSLDTSGKKKQTRRISCRTETVIPVARNGSEKRFPLGSAEGVWNPRSVGSRMRK